MWSKLTLLFHLSCILYTLHISVVKLIWPAFLTERIFCQNTRHSLLDCFILVLTYPEDSQISQSLLLIQDQASTMLPSVWYLPCVQSLQSGQPVTWNGYYAPVFEISYYPFLYRIRGEYDTDKFLSLTSFLTRFEQAQQWCVGYIQTYKFQE